jgi:hypothetical protein
VSLHSILIQGSSDREVRARNENACVWKQNHFGVIHSGNDGAVEDAEPLVLKE